ncbi:MAG: carboxypeptidase-like regulatory domain-containing protein, partial [Candidatus Tumulicola sp.]
MRGSLVAIALAATFLTGAAFAIAGTTGSITGMVVTASGGAPISGARVSATSPSQVAIVATDAAGRFSLLSLAPDAYEVTVSKPGFVTASTRGLSVLADQVQTVRFGLVAA